MDDVRYRLCDFFCDPGWRVGTDGTFWGRRKSKPLGYHKGTESYLSNTWTRIRGSKTSNNRIIVAVTINSVRKQFQLARIVLEAFVGPCPIGMECCHNNGDSLDNSIDNLRWDTHKSNELDKNLHGTRPYGELINLNKLKAKDIPIIRNFAYNGKSYAWIARTISKINGISITPEAISNVVKRKTWKNV